MNLQQLHYVLALDETRHFEEAARKCFVTQSTLSTMIARFEEELGIQLFDRSVKPVVLTREGEEVLAQVRRVLAELEQLNELGRNIKGEVKGKLSISVIPTIAPYLLPIFVQDFASRFPALQIRVREETTSEILRQIKARELDIGILSVPLNDKEILELELYEEPFLFYDAGRNLKKEVAISKINPNKLCLMEEGHCMRTQVARLCDLNKGFLARQLNFEFKAGSIDSLLRFVRSNKASTLLPFLSTLDLREEEKQHLGEFSSPVPYRRVGLVVHRHFVKKNLLQALQKEIREKVAEHMPLKIRKGNMLEPV